MLQRRPQQRRKSREGTKRSFVCIDSPSANTRDAVLYVHVLKITRGLPRDSGNPLDFSNRDLAVAFKESPDARGVASARFDDRRVESFD